MEIINDPSLDPLARDSYDVFVKKVRTNFLELYALILSGTLLYSKLTTNLVIGEEYNIPGGDFTPAITKQPTFMIAIMRSEDNTVTDISHIIKGAVLNDSVYDITITALEENYSNVTISIL